MKVIFLLDTNEFIETTPEKLQLRELEGGVSAIGTEVNVPVRKEDGSFDTDEHGKLKTQVGFVPLVTYPVKLSPTPDPETVVIHKDGKTRVTDSNDPEAKLLAASGSKVRKTRIKESR